jgi:hypothetical protein
LFVWWVGGKCVSGWSGLFSGAGGGRCACRPAPGAAHRGSGRAFAPAGTALPKHWFCPSYFTPRDHRVCSHNPPDALRTRRGTPPGGLRVRVALKAKIAQLMRTRILRMGLHTFPADINPTRHIKHRQFHKTDKKPQSPISRAQPKTRQPVASGPRRHTARQGSAMCNVALKLR